MVRFGAKIVGEYLAELPADRRAALAAQKNYLSLYLMNVYADKETERWFVERYRASGKKLNMGKSCVRFKRVDDLPIDLIGDAIARTPVAEFIKRYEASRRGT